MFLTYHCAVISLVGPMTGNIIIKAKPTVLLY